MEMEYPTPEAATTAVRTQFPDARILPGLSELYSEQAYFDAATHTLIGLFNLNGPPDPLTLPFVKTIRARDLLYSTEFLWFFSDSFILKDTDVERFERLWQTSLDELLDMIATDVSQYDTENVTDSTDLEGALEAAIRDHRWGLFGALELSKRHRARQSEPD